MQTYYRCEEGSKARANLVATKACKKLVTDMHHETIITYYGSKVGEKISKEEARKMTLTRD